MGNKYVTNFIIFRLKDRKQTEDVSALVVSMLADKFEVILREAENKISALDFYGNDFGIGRLGYIVVPYLLRHKISDVKNNRLKLENGPYPPRKDGGYGWFIVEETVDESKTVQSIIPDAMLQETTAAASTKFRRISIIIGSVSILITT